MGKLSKIFGGAISKLRELCGFGEAPGTLIENASSEKSVEDESVIGEDTSQVEAESAGCEGICKPAAERLSNESSPSESIQKKDTVDKVEASENTEKAIPVPQGTKQPERTDSRNRPLPKSTIYFELNGEKKTLGELAKQLKVSKMTIQRRIQKWGSPVPPEGWNPIKETKPIIEDVRGISFTERDGRWFVVKDGIVHSVYDFASSLGIPYTTLLGRIKKSRDPKKVFGPLVYLGNKATRKTNIVPKLWEFNGEKKTTAEWAETYGVSEAQMRLRLNATGDPSNSDIKKSAYNERRTKRYKWKDGEYSIVELCKMLGISQTAMRRRLKRYGTPELPPKEQRSKPTQEGDAVGKTEKRVHAAREYEYNGISMTAMGWADELGVSVDTIRRRIKLFGSPIASQVKKRRLRKMNVKFDDEVLIDDVSSESYEEIFGTADRTVLYTYGGTCKTLDEWSFQSGLPRNVVANNFKEFGCPIDPTPKTNVFAQDDGKPHSKTYNDFKREVSRIMRKDDDMEPLSKLVGYGEVDD